ncbi:MAG: cytosine deaminase [Labrys sp. (in: a-proteobacteria)]
MQTGFARPPRGASFAIVGARVPAALVAGPTLAADRDGLAEIALRIEGGRIAEIGAPDMIDVEALDAIDLDGGMLFPAFVDLHTHLDKGHIWPRRRNPDATFFGALDAVTLDREANWSARDVAARMDFALRCAFAHGTAAIRTHLDSIGKQTAISWPVFAELRERWRGRIDLQAVALFTIEQALDPAHMGEIRRTLIEHDGVMGGVTYMVPDLDHALDTLFRTAMDEGFDLDFHVDETQDPEARSLRHVAEAAIRHRFSGQITVGHCCSLARQPEDEARATIDRVAEAGIAVVSLPMCNMYLQDRHAGRTPRSRGVTLLHELKAAGVKVSVSSDNARDPVYAYGDLDVLEVFREATRIAHLDHPFGDWPRAVTATPAQVMGIEAGVLRRGGVADLVLFRARGYTELLARPQADRSVMRAGRLIDTTLPDYRELDPVLAID